MAVQGTLGVEDEEEEWIGIGEEFDEFEEALQAPEDNQLDPYYFVRSGTTSAQGSIWHAARVGDLERVQ